MAVFYIDVLGETGQAEDEEGHDFPSEAAMQVAVRRILTDLARDELADGAGGLFAVRVRDSDGRAIYEASLTFTERWL